MKSAIILQDLMLNTLRKDHTPVTVHITNGFQIRGIIQGFDSFVIILDNDGKQMMIYKHAISSITPSKAVVFNMTADTEQ